MTYEYSPRVLSESSLHAHGSEFVDSGAGAGCLAQSVQAQLAEMIVPS